MSVVEAELSRLAEDLSIILVCVTDPEEQCQAFLAMVLGKMNEINADAAGMLPGYSPPEVTDEGDNTDVDLDLDEEDTILEDL